MPDLQFLGTAEGLNEKIAEFQELGRIFRLNQNSLEQRIKNLQANGTDVSVEIQALEVLKKENGATS